MVAPSPIQPIQPHLDTKTVTVPAGFSGDGLEVWLTAGRIQRSAKFYADGELFGEHVGYLSVFEARVPVTSASASSFELRIEVNATRKQGVDGLQGEEDLETDGTGLGGWGGLGGHVNLESRASAGWIESPHVQQVISEDFRSASLFVDVEIGGLNSSRRPGCQITTVVKLNGTVVARPAAATCNASGPTCSVPGFAIGGGAIKLWSPDTPTQYTVVISLFDTRGRVLDTQVVTIGLRKLERVGYHFKLNGGWLWLHGYGDDAIYPWTVSPPLNFSFYRTRLAYP